MNEQPARPKPKNWLWPAAYQVALLASTVIALVMLRGLGQAQRLWLIALVGSSALWHWLSIIEVQQARGDLRATPQLTSISLAILAILWYPLLLIHPVFYLILPGLILQAAVFLPLRWAIPGVLALGTLAGLNLLA